MQSEHCAADTAQGAGPAVQSRDAPHLAAVAGQGLLQPLQLVAMGLLRARRGWRGKCAAGVSPWPPAGQGGIVRRAGSPASKHTHLAAHHSGAVLADDLGHHLLAVVPAVVPILLCSRHARLGGRVRVPRCCSPLLVGATPPPPFCRMHRLAVHADMHPPSRKRLHGLL